MAAHALLGSVTAPDPESKSGADRNGQHGPPIVGHEYEHEKIGVSDLQGVADGLAQADAAVVVRGIAQRRLVLRVDVN